MLSAYSEDALIEQSAIQLFAEVLGNGVSVGRIVQFPSAYAPLLADLKARVRAAQVRAVLSVNREMLLLYWNIGRGILGCQRDEGWGAGVSRCLY